MKRKLRRKLCKKKIKEENNEGRGNYEGKGKLSRGKS